MREEEGEGREGEGTKNLNLKSVLKYVEVCLHTFYKTCTGTKNFFIRVSSIVFPNQLQGSNLRMPKNNYSRYKQLGQQLDMCIVKTVSPV